MHATEKRPSLARRLLMVWMVFIAIPAQADSPATLNGFTLTRLWQPGDTQLSQWDKQWKVVSFFEPECGWCRKQLQALAALAPEYPVPIIAIGVHGDRVALRRMLPRQSPLVGVVADHALLRALGGVDATPLTLLVDSDGQIRYRVQGYVPPDVSEALLIAAERQQLSP